MRKYKEESFFGIEILSEKPVGIFSGEEDKESNKIIENIKGVRIIL